MATNINRTGKTIPRQYDRPMPDNPGNYRPGITGNKTVIVPPNTNSTFRQRNATNANQSTRQTTLVGDNPANLHVERDDSRDAQPARSTGPSRSDDYGSDDDRLDHLIGGYRSPSLTGDEQDFGSLKLDDNTWMVNAP